MIPRKTRYNVIRSEASLEVLKQRLQNLYFDTLKSVNAIRRYICDILNFLISLGARRMEQIKRQLIVQRGSIVAALKHVAQARSVQSGIIDASATWW